MISLEELKEYLGIEADDDSEDAVLTEMEANAVAFIQTQTGRYFGPPDEHEEIVEGTGSRRLYLNDIPIREPGTTEGDPYVGLLILSSVDERSVPGATFTTLTDEADFEVRVNGKEAYLVRWSGSRWTQDYEYTVAYWRGYPAGQEPGDIRQLVLDMISVKRSMRGNEGLRSETIGGYSYTRFGDTDMDAVTGGWATIYAWRRPVFA